MGIGVIGKCLIFWSLVFNTKYFWYFNHWYEEKNHEYFYFYVCSCSNRFFFVLQLMSFVCSKVYPCCFFKVDVTFFLKFSILTERKADDFSWVSLSSESEQKHYLFTRPLLQKGLNLQEEILFVCLFVRHHFFLLRILNDMMV